MPVTGALHCNLNVRRLEPAAAVYEQGLGMRVQMRSRTEAGDSSALGIDGPTDTDVWFLYDQRGGRVGPAVELVQWEDPPTAGAAYADDRDVGMQALGFHVPSVVDAGRALVAAGATPADAGDDRVGATLRDADGVTLELLELGATEHPVFAYVRCNCADVDRTARWYESLGLRRARDNPGERMTFGDESGFSVLLAHAPGTDAAGRAHRDANHRGLFRMAFAVDDAREAVATIRARGLTSGDPVFVPLPGTRLGGLWVAFLRDPDGVTVELVERPAG